MFHVEMMMVLVAYFVVTWVCISVVYTFVIKYRDPDRLHWFE